MRPLKTSGILLLVLLALGGLATWDEWQSEKEAVEKENKNRLLTIDTDNINEIHYQSSDGKAGSVNIVLAKVSGNWLIKDPINATADNMAVANFLKAAKDYNYERIITTDKTKYKDYGVDENVSRQVKFTSETGETTTILVGDEASVGYKCYALLKETGEVILGSQHLRIFMNKAVFDFREKRVVSFNSVALASLTFERKNKTTIRAERFGDDWRLTLPTQAEADVDEVREFASAIIELRASAFFDQPKEELRESLVNPDFRISLATESGEQVSMAVANYGGKLVGGFDPNKLVFELPDNLGVQLAKNVLDFRDRRVLNLDANEIDHIEVDGVPFKRIDGNWFSASEPAYEASHLQALVVDLEFARADAFYPRDRLTVEKISKSADHTLRFSKGSELVTVIELYRIKGDDQRFLVDQRGSELLYRMPIKEFDGMKSFSRIEDEPDDDEDGLF